MKITTKILLSISSLQVITSKKLYLIIDYTDYSRGQVQSTYCNRKSNFSRRSVKRKVFPLQARLWPRRIALLFHDHGTRRGEGSAPRPGHTLPPGKTRYPLYRRLGGPQSRSGRVENLAPPGFDPRTVQPVVNRYTDWATRPIAVDQYTVINVANESNHL